MNTGERIRNRRKELHLSIDDVANKLKKNRATVYRYENGDIENMPITVLQPIAEVLQTTPAYLMGWDDDIEKSIENIKGIKPLPQGKKIPVVGTIACGTPILAEENTVGYVSTNKDDKADFALICKGESMSPKFLDKDLVLIHQQPTVDDGQIAAVLIDDEATLKRVYFHDNSQIILSPENPTFAPIVLNNHDLDTVKILGKAVGFIRYFE